MADTSASRGLARRRLLSAMAPLLFLSAFFVHAKGTAAVVRSYEFNLTYVTIAPDCVAKKVVAVNGQSPGPAMTANVGDTFRVKMCNHLPDQVVSLHWHGLHQKGSQWYDGVANGTQCPIPPTQCYTYVFGTGGQFGTFWWHGHVGLLRSSVYGSLIIHPRKSFAEPFAKPYGDQVLLFNDWYHRSDADILAGLHSAKAWRFIGEPNSLLINGRGRQDCSTYTCAAQDYVPGTCGKCQQNVSSCFPPTTLTVRHGRTYRLRFINVALWGQLNILIEGHTMTVVEIDGSYTKPYTVTSLTTAPSEAFSVLVTFDRPVRDYWLAAHGIYDNLGVPSGLAVVHYASCRPGVCSNPPMPRTPVPPCPSFTNYAFGPYQQLGFKSLNTVAGLATKKVDRYIVLQWDMNMQPDGAIRYSVNNFSHVPGTTPLLASQYLGLPGEFTAANEMEQQPAPLPAGDYALHPAKLVVNSVLTVQQNEYVQVVLQNHSPPGGNHPWHLHGHDFYVVGYGAGQYRAKDEWSYARKYNLIDPPLRNVVTVWENHWIAIRFVADNPGIWNMHCHMEPHFELGMQLFLRVNSSRGALPRLPADYLKCGKLLA